VRQSDETWIENIGKLCGSHRLGSDGGKRFVLKSTALRDFAKEMIHRGCREFFVDLCNCPVMDSTFMGTLAGISLWLGELGESCLSVVNLNERNAESLCSLGLDQLFQRTRERHKKGRASSSNTAGRRPHRSGADDVGSSRGLDQDRP